MSDLAEVERLAKEVLSPGLGERLRAVRDALADRRAAIERIERLDPPDAFPATLQEVLARLPVVPLPELGEGPSAGLLGRIQRELQRPSRAEVPQRVPWSDDGSLQVYRAETRLTAARWLADVIGTGGEDTLVLAQSDADLLDEVLGAANQARCGFTQPSAFRPPLQVVPLAMALLWEPLDVVGLLEFLTHPVCPIRAYARHRIAEKIAAAPGIGGPQWEQTLAEIRAHYRDDADRAVEAIRTWVEAPRFDPGEGAPSREVLSRAQRLAEFFYARLAEEDPARRFAFNAGFAQCQTLTRALMRLVEQEVERIKPRQLDQLLTQAPARGSGNPMCVAETGSVFTATRPGAVIEPFRSVIWWQMGMPPLPSAYPWSSRELAELAGAGARFPSLESRLRRESEAWARPLRAARERLVLVLPPTGEEVHPMWQLIEAILDTPRIVPLEKVLSGTLPGIQAAPVTVRTLPQRRRWWQMPHGVALPQRTQHSFSGLNLLFNNPYHWVLQYLARLDASSVLTVADGRTLFGTLAHRTVERLFWEEGALGWTPDKVKRWVAAEFPRLIEQEGAVLLMGGRRAELEEFRGRLVSAVVNLHGRLRRARVTQAQAERPFAGAFEGGELTGKGDLVLSNKAGAAALVEMKWSSRKWHSERLTNNRHLQLAVYGELMRQETGTWPEAAYFIFDEGTLLAAARGFFPDAQPMAKNTEEGIAVLWQRALAMWRWRERQLRAGKIEVVLDEIEATEESAPPADALEVETQPPGYNPHLRLSGWEADA